MTTTPTTTTQLPTLYKRNSNGSLNQWTITVADATITTIYGQVGGAMQTTSDTITEGKNIGRSNATTPQQQAQLEATAQHEKKRKSGYVADLATAQQGGTDDIIEGGVPPMLAKVYEDRADKVMFPVAVQPKLDGHHENPLNNRLDNLECMPAAQHWDLHNRAREQHQQINGVEHRKCQRCSTFKPLTNFSVRRAGMYHGYCKICGKQYLADWRAKNRVSPDSRRT